MDCMGRKGLMGNLEKRLGVNTLKNIISSLICNDLSKEQAGWWNSFATYELRDLSTNYIFVSVSCVTLKE